MIDFKIWQALLIHCIVVSITICIIAAILYKKKLLTLYHSGTWILGSCGLYFLYHPAVCLLSGNLQPYMKTLSVYSGIGANRVLWILLCIICGLICLYSVYANGRNHATESRIRRQRISSEGWTIPQIFVVVLVTAVAMYVTLYYRTRDTFVSSRFVTESDLGRHVGGATGYATTAHIYFLFIVVLLLYRKSILSRLSGIVLAGFYLIIRLYDTHDRASIVSMIAALAIVISLKGLFKTDALNGAIQYFKMHKIRSGLLLLGAASMALFLAVRGHRSISKVKDIDWSQGSAEMQKFDIAMLPTLYVWSTSYERYGYDYGVYFVNSLFFGALPRQYFPWKDRVGSKILGQENIRYNPSYVMYFFGKKSTVLGGFYGHAGIIAVIIGMLILGLLLRRLDRIVFAAKTELGRSMGIVWLSELWIMFGSDGIWILQRIFITAIPFLAMYLTFKLTHIEQKEAVRVLKNGVSMQVKLKNSEK